jgi:hypothetical protein
MHCENPGGGGGGSGTQIMPGSTQGDQAPRHARANVSQAVLPLLGGGGVIGAHALSVRVSASTRTDLGLKSAGTGLRSVQVPSQGSGAEKSWAIPVHVTVVCAVRMEDSAHSPLGGAQLHAGHSWSAGSACPS